MSTAKQDGNPDQGLDRKDWREPVSLHIPEPTSWPAVLALAACFSLWGVLTSPWLTVVGLAGVVLSAVRWMIELRDEPDE